jgi:hypothetical protein
MAISSTGHNIFLIVVTCIAALMIAAVTVYLLAAFSHPEDKMQAWFPKIVVCFSIFVAITTVLMFPLDVANRKACDPDILFSDCKLTLPMKGMWYGIYIINIVLVYLITPFTLFFYEADSELCGPFPCNLLVSCLQYTKQGVATTFTVTFTIISCCWKKLMIELPHAYCVPDLLLVQINFHAGHWQSAFGLQSCGPFSPFSSSQPF